MNEEAKLRAELAALRTLHTDKIIAFDALAKRLARVESLADEYDAKYGLSKHKRSFIADELYADLRAVLAAVDEANR